jgi:putative transposase
MARPLRLEFAGALYHLTSRGDRKENIVENDLDRHCFLAILGEVIDTYDRTLGSGLAFSLLH